MSLWASPDVPKRGWVCVGSLDFEKDYQTCMMCDNDKVRYIHTMQHPDFRGSLEVGCICAGYMAGDLDIFKEKEKYLKKISGKKDRWIFRNWKISKKGNFYLKSNGIVVVVFKHRHGSHVGSYGFNINSSMISGFSEGVFPTLESAKRASFDAYLDAEMRNS